VSGPGIGLLVETRDPIRWEMTTEGDWAESRSCGWGGDIADMPTWSHSLTLPG
jgi:hypothetical protein